MNTQLEDTAMRSHELIHGRTGTTTLTRQRIAVDPAHAWVIDPHMKAPDLAQTVTRYACTASETEALLVDLARTVHARAEQQTSGDPITVTVLGASDVLIDRRNVALVERVVQMSRKTGVRFRLVVPKPYIGWFGGSELIRSAMTSGDVFACEKATA